MVLWTFCEESGVGRGPRQLMLPIEIVAPTVHVYEVRVFETIHPVSSNR